MSADGGVAAVLSGRARRGLAGGLAGAALLWLIALVAAPYLAAHGTTAVAWLGTAGVYLTGAILCHQQPARTFHAWGAPLPVCARCLGLYAGAALGAATAFVFWRRRPVTRTPRLLPTSLRSWRTLLLAASAPTAATVLIEWLGRAALGNVLRSAAAVPLGAAISAFVVSSLMEGSRVRDRVPGVDCDDAIDHCRAAEDA